jgi:tRNA 5-methylaminomethyl-2-thiouridine biosynthesis bifunctional protein
MKTEAIVPVEPLRNADGVPFSPLYGDVYHPAAGALEQARHVFLGGNDLPARWQGRDRFVVLETGFGLGNNFLATWAAWRHDAHACGQLHFISIEKHPLTREAMRALPRYPTLAASAAELVDAWPPLTPNLHRLSFDGGRVQLLLVLGDVAAWLPELVARVDAFYLDGFAPSKNPQMWQPRLYKALGRLAAPQATLATWTAARPVREGLQAAGFTVHLASGRGGKRDITHARYAPAFVPRRTPARSLEPASDQRHALVIGAGLAGCAVAWALAEHGWSSLLLERQAGPAQEASGNPAGLFHGIVNAQDGTHARFNRAAALQAQVAIGSFIARGHAHGEAGGLLRLDTSGGTAGAMQQVLRRLGLPSDYVRALTADEASALSGIALQQPAWFYPGGGWIRPADLAAAFLERAGPAACCRANTAVHALRRRDGRWQALDAAGEVSAQAETVVLANAGDALRLLGRPQWPIEMRRGQISIGDAAHFQPMPRLPIAGAGYLLPAIAGQAIFGATSQPGDGDPATRAGDHVHNLAQLERLTGRSLHVPVDALQGRVGWRWSSDDRLPLIGAVPDDAAADLSSRLDQPRFVPRLPGAFVFTGLGSRGITWCALGAQVLASIVSGAPVPLEASLLDSVDPARFRSRDARRAEGQR